MVLTIGADPELLLLDGNGGTICASTCISSGSDDEDNIVGWDGNSTLGEIRPRHARNAIDLASNVKRCLKVLYGERLKEDYMPEKAIGGSGNQANCIGGHIHFGTPYDDRLFAAFDAVSLLILQIEDSPQNKYRRYNPHTYGRLGAYRPQTWGCEYRTPASWLISPPITEGILCLYHAVAMGFKNRTNKPNKLIEIGESITETDKDDFVKGNASAFSTRLPVIVSCIKKLSAYKNNEEYKKRIDYILGMVERGEKWREERDIFSTWSVKNTRNCLIHYSGDLFMENYDDINAPKERDKALYVYGRMRNNYDCKNYMRVYSDSDVVVKTAKEFLESRKVPKILVRKEERLTNRNCTELGLGLALRKDTALCRELIFAIKEKMTENTIKEKDDRELAKDNVTIKQIKHN